MSRKPSDELINLIAYVKNQIDKRLIAFYNSKLQSAGKIDSAYLRLLRSMQKLNSRGGKRIRPFLGLLGYKLAGGRDDGLFLDLAVAMELFHSFLLIHDDVMDGDTYRYGGVNLIGEYERLLNRQTQDTIRNRKTAESLAILAGDLSFSFVYEIINRSVFVQSIKEALSNEITDTTFKGVAGQQLDVLSHTKTNLSIKAIEKVYLYKTGLYTVNFPLRFGIIASGGNPNDFGFIEDYARFVGIAYQLADDLMGIFGSKKEIGKPIGSDLREGKQTLLLAYAKKLCNKQQRQTLLDIISSSDLTDDQIKIARNILIDCGAQSKAIVEMNKYSELAKQRIHKVKEIDKEIKNLLVTLADFIIERKK